MMAKKKIVVCGGNGFLGELRLLLCKTEAKFCARLENLQVGSRERMGRNLNKVPYSARSTMTVIDTLEAAPANLAGVL